jgi:hypothetical protein
MAKKTATTKTSVAKTDTTKAAKTATTKKATTKKATTKAEKTAAAKKADSLRLRVFKLLAKHSKGATPGLPMAAIREQLELSAPCALVKHECLAAKPRMKRAKYEGARGVHYFLTAAGLKALKDGTVDEKLPPSSVGESELVNRA